MKRAIRCVLLAILATVATGCDRREPVQAQAQVQRLPRIDLAGLREQIAAADAANQWLVIDFWATWCVPCVEMFPQLHGQLHGLANVRMISVTLDSGAPYEAAAIAFLAQNKALQDAYICPDPEQQLQVVRGLGQRWQDVVVPAILVFDPDGQLQGEFIDQDAQVQQIVQSVRGWASPHAP